MSTIDTIQPAWGSVTPDTSALRYSPEPDSSFGDVFSTVANQISGAAGVVASSVAGVDPGSQALLATQLKIQQQMQTVSLISNLYKSEHETQMAAVRNVRVG